MQTGNQFSNQVGYNSEEYNKLIEEAMKLPITEGYAKYAEAEKLMLEDGYLAPIYQKASAYLEKDYVSGIVNNSWGADYTYTYADVDKDDKVLNLATSSDIPTLDLSKATDQQSFQTANTTMEGLTRVDAEGNAALSDSHYILPHPVLNDELCRMLRNSVNLPQHVQAHSDAVTELACRLCDILKVHGYLFDQQLIRSGALLHDIARLQKHHTKTGGDLFLQLGYPEISQIISQHHGLKETKLDETAIVFLADKLIEETQRVSIEKRFADNLHKCKSPEAMKSHERQLKQARALQDMIQSICYITL